MNLVNVWLCFMSAYRKWAPALHYMHQIVSIKQPINQTNCYVGISLHACVCAFMGGSLCERPVQKSTWIRLLTVGNMTIRKRWIYINKNMRGTRAFSRLSSLCTTKLIHSQWDHTQTFTYRNLNFFSFFYCYQL